MFTSRSRRLLVTVLLSALGTTGVFAGAQIQAAQNTAAGADRVLFTSERAGNEEIYSMNADGSDVVRHTTSDGSDAIPAFSPDGRSVVFTSERGGNSDVWIARADGTGQPTNLTGHMAADAAGVFSPNGRMVAFHSERDGNFELYVVNTDGSGLRRLTRHDGRDMFPHWTPDGKSLVFQRDYDIHAVDVASGEVRPLVVHEAREDMPVVSPDGRQIAFMSSRDGYCSVFVAEITGAAPRNITPRPAGVQDGWCSYYPEWSRDGQQVYFSSVRPGSVGADVYVTNLDGSGVRQLTNAQGDDYAPSVR